MKKVITYTSFAVTSLLVILGFVTATTYTQLGIAIALYPVLAFFAYKLFMVKTGKVSKIPSPTPSLEPEGQPNIEIAEIKKEDIKVADIDKRAFLKIIGASGISFFLLSLINRKISTPIFGNPSQTGISTLTDNAGVKINPAERLPTDGFTISEIDDRDVVYYGFTNNYGAWFIMKENNDGSFRYAKGESKFPDNWDNRDDLTYDYYHRVF